MSMFDGGQVAAELAKFELHLIKGLPLSRMVGVALQIATPLALLLREHIPWRFYVARPCLGWFNAGDLSGAFGNIAAQLLDLELQLVE